MQRKVTKKVTSEIATTLLAKIVKEMETNTFEEEKTIIAEFIEANNCTALDLASALLHMKLSKNKTKEIEFKEASRGSVGSGRSGKGDTVRLFITLGK